MCLCPRRVFSLSRTPEETRGFQWYTVTADQRKSLDVMSHAHYIPALLLKCPCEFKPKSESRQCSGLPRLSSHYCLYNPRALHLCVLCWKRNTVGAEGAAQWQSTCQACVRPWVPAGLPQCHAVCADGEQRGFESLMDTGNSTKDPDSQGMPDKSFPHKKFKYTTEPSMEYKFLHNKILGALNFHS